MLDLDISLLRLTIENARGHEHRVQAIAVRATELLAARLDLNYGEEDSPATGTDTAGVAASAVDVDLSRTGNEQAAQMVAAAWLDAISLQLKG